MLAEIRAVIDRRAALIAELSAIDREMAELLELLGVSLVPAVERSVVSHGSDTKVDKRRAALLAALADGPQWPSALAALPEYTHTSRGTVTNDLYALGKQGRVVNQQEGWALAVDGDAEAEPDPLLNPATAYQR